MCSVQFLQHSVFKNNEISKTSNTRVIQDRLRRCLQMNLLFENSGNVRMLVSCADMLWKPVLAGTLAGK